jgi:hypothetical protein
MGLSWQGEEPFTLSQEVDIYIYITWMYIYSMNIYLTEDWTYCRSTLQTTKKAQIQYTVFALIPWFWVSIYINSMIYINFWMRYANHDRGESYAVATLYEVWICICHVSLFSYMDVMYTHVYMYFSI